MKDKQALVLDTSAFIMGINPSILNPLSYTTPLVCGELHQDTLTTQRINASELSGKLIVITPSDNSINKILEVSRSLGEQISLSKTDITVLALALDLKAMSIKPLIISDDFGIQNVSESLHIKYASLANKGISKLLAWTIYCPACFQKYPESKAVVCQVCGTSLKKKSDKNRLAKYKK